MCKFIGVQRIDFVDQKSGEVIKGYNFWFTEPAGSNGVGEKPFKHFLRDEYAENFFGQNGVSGYAANVGKSCVVTYNRYGKMSELIFK